MNGSDVAGLSVIDKNILPQKVAKSAMWTMLSMHEMKLNPNLLLNLLISEILYKNVNFGGLT